VPRQHPVRVKKKFLRDLAANGGNVSAAARTAGINRSVGFAWAQQAGAFTAGKPGRPPHPQRGRYDTLRADGVPRAQAAAVVGVLLSTAADWDREVAEGGRWRRDGRWVDYKSGVISACPPAGSAGAVRYARAAAAAAAAEAAQSASLAAVEATLHPRFLAITERETIADLRREGKSLRAIGRVLGRPASTIKRELDARSVPLPSPVPDPDAVPTGAEVGAEVGVEVGVEVGESGPRREYHPHAAQRAWAASRARPKDSKLAAPGPLRAFVLQKLTLRWSPEQISHALVQDFPDEVSMRVSVETIYQALYLQARGGLRAEVAAALRSGRTRRVPHRRPDQRTPRFIDPMLMISQRPAEVQDRAVPGHWEGDLIVGTASRSAIVTLVERSTRYVMLGHLPGGHTAEEVRDVLVTLIATLPQHLRGSLTWDQGSEMAAHRQFSIATGVPVYFCDPHSPWQRGSNENTNGLLRQYFPKGTDLSVHSAADLEYVAQELNGRPRKTLGWAKPAERLRDLLTLT
jgi:transposase, IS30 family